MSHFFTLLCFIILLPLCSYAQEDPFYELPKDRRTRHELLTMPNLDAKVLKWYISASGGLKPGNSQMENNLDGLLTKSKLMNTFWEINFGHNRNYNFYFETGIMQNPVFVSSYFSERISRNVPIIFKHGHNYISIPLRVKKRLVILDKVTRMAWVNAGAAILYSPGMRAKDLRTIDIDLLRRSNGGQVDTVAFHFNSRQQQVPVNFELMTEIGGKIVEQLEISVFAKAIIYPKPVIKSSFTLVYDPNDVSSAVQRSNPLMIQFGLNLKFNYPAVVRYESRL